MLLFLFFLYRSGKASPIPDDIMTSVGEEIKCLSSSIVTHTEKLWVTATRTPSLGIGGSTFLSDGKVSPTSILCTVETGTSTPPVPEKEDKAVATESVSVDTKMAECISKLRTVRQRLEQTPGSPGPVRAATSAPPSGGAKPVSTGPSSISTPAEIHPAPRPIYTRTQSSPVCTVTSSPERAAKVSPKSTPSREIRVRETGYRDSPASSTDSGPDSPNNTVTRGRKARKQRLDLSQMLRSNMAKDLDSPPLHPPNVLPKPPPRPSKLRNASGNPPLIPKLDMKIKDYRSHSPGVKRRARPKSTGSLSSVAAGCEFLDQSERQMLIKAIRPGVQKPEVPPKHNFLQKGGMLHGPVWAQDTKLKEDFVKGQEPHRTIPQAFTVQPVSVVLETAGPVQKQDRVSVKVAMPNKVDTTFPPPREDNIKRTERPIVRKLNTQMGLRRSSVQDLRESNREPTKSHVEWFKNRILNRQHSFDDVTSQSGNGSGGTRSQATNQDTEPQPPKVPGLQRSLGKLQILCPDDGTDACWYPPPIVHRRRASVDTASMGRGAGVGLLVAAAPQPAAWRAGGGGHVREPADGSRPIARRGSLPTATPGGNKSSPRRGSLPSPVSESPEGRSPERQSQPVNKPKPNPGARPKLQTATASHSHIPRPVHGKSRRGSVA